MDPKKVDLHFICRSENEAQNCTSPKVVESGHDRNMAEVFSDTYSNLYTNGENVTLFCDIEGDPYPKITWTSSNGLELSDFSEQVTSDGKLKLSNVTREDTGAYYCHLTTISYKEVDSKVNLRVIDGTKPNITQVKFDIHMLNYRIREKLCFTVVSVYKNIF